MVCCVCLSFFSCKEKNEEREQERERESRRHLFFFFVLRKTKRDDEKLNEGKKERECAFHSLSLALSQNKTHIHTSHHALPRPGGDVGRGRVGGGARAQAR